MKLELKHLAPYLPYGLKWVFEGDDVVHEVSGLDISAFGVQLISDDDFGKCTLENGKPILRPLSSMSLEEIDELNGLIDDSVMVVVSSGNWVYIDGLNSDPWSGSPTLSLYSINKINEYLLSKHFDVFRLIDKDLAVEKR